MKSTKAVPTSIDAGNMSIPAAEEIVEEALNELAYSTDPGLVRALRFLAPPGYQAIVELCSENGRSKRRNASADSWSPEEDEVRIYFERIDGEDAPVRAARSQRGASASRAVVSHAFDEDDEQEPILPADMDLRVKELCRARRARIYRAQMVSRFVFAAQGIPLESAAGYAAGRAR